MSFRSKPLTITASFLKYQTTKPPKFKTNVYLNTLEMPYIICLTLVRNISGPHNSANLLHRLQIRRQTCESNQQKSFEIQFSLHTSSHALDLKYSTNKQQESFLFLISYSVKVISIRGNSLPPWQQNIFSSKIAATGRQLKQSVNVFHNFILYLLLP